MCGGGGGGGDWKGTGEVIHLFLCVCVCGGVGGGGGKGTGKVIHISNCIEKSGQKYFHFGQFLILSSVV